MENTQYKIQYLWIILSFVLWVCIFVNNNFTHFTWWSITSFATYTACCGLGIEHHFYWMFLSIQLNVIAGVLVMSFYGCDMLINTLNDVGGFTYLIGNFIMHYAPFLVAVAYSKISKNAYIQKHAFSSVLGGYGFFNIYNSFFSATHVYGCSFDDRYVIVGSAALTLLLLGETQTHIFNL